MNLKAVFESAGIKVDDAAVKKIEGGLKAILEERLKEKNEEIKKLREARKRQAERFKEARKRHVETMKKIREGVEKRVQKRAERQMKVKLASLKREMAKASAKIVEEKVKAFISENKKLIARGLFASRWKNLAEKIVENKALMEGVDSPVVRLRKENSRLKRQLSEAKKKLVVAEAESALPSEASRRKFRKVVESAVDEDIVKVLSDSLKSTKRPVSRLRRRGLKETRRFSRPVRKVRLAEKKGEAEVKITDLGLKLNIEK